MDKLDNLMEKAIKGDLNTVKGVLTNFTPEEINEKYSYDALSRAYLDKNVQFLDGEIKEWRKWNINFKDNNYSTAKIPEKYRK